MCSPLRALGAGILCACVRALALQSQAVSCELHDVVLRTNGSPVGEHRATPESLDDTVSPGKLKDLVCMLWGGGEGRGILRKKDEDAPTGAGQAESYSVNTARQGD